MKFAKFLRPPVLKNISCSCFHSFGKISVNLSVPMKLLLYKRGREREREREYIVRVIPIFWIIWFIYLHFSHLFIFTNLIFLHSCFQPLTVITKSSTLDVAAVLDPPLNTATLTKRQPVEVLCEKGVLTNFVKLTGKHLF